MYYKVADDILFPKLNGPNDEAAAELGRHGKVQIQILTWYTSLFTSHRKNEDDNNMGNGMPASCRENSINTST